MVFTIQPGPDINALSLRSNVVLLTTLTSLKHLFYTYLKCIIPIQYFGSASGNTHSALMKIYGIYRSRNNAFVIFCLEGWIWVLIASFLIFAYFLLLHNYILTDFKNATPRLNANIF